MLPLHRPQNTEQRSAAFLIDPLLNNPLLLKPTTRIDLEPSQPQHQPSASAHLTILRPDQP